VLCLVVNRSVEVSRQRLHQDDHSELMVWPSVGYIRGRAAYGGSGRDIIPKATNA
jgi:hypothetical protein